MSSWVYLDDYPFNTDHTNGSGSGTTSNPGSNPLDSSNLWFDNSLNYKDYPTALLSNPNNLNDVGVFDDFLFDEKYNTNTTHQITAPGSTSSSSSPVLPQTPTDIINSIPSNETFVGEVREVPNNNLVNTTMNIPGDQYTTGISSFSNNNIPSQGLYVASNGNIFPYSPSSTYNNEPLQSQFSPTLTDRELSAFSSFSMDINDFKGLLLPSTSPTLSTGISNPPLTTILPPSPKSTASPLPASTITNAKRKMSTTKKTSTPPPPTAPVLNSSPPRAPRKHSESRMSLPELYNLMGLGNDPTEARIRERRVLELLQKEGFLLGQRTWIRDTEQSERQRIIDNIFDATHEEYSYEKDLIELIIRRGTYYVMQGRLRRLRRKRAQEQANSNDHGDIDTGSGDIEHVV